MMRIALDIDGTLCDTNTACVQAIAEHLGVECPDPKGVRDYHDQATIFPEEHRETAHRLFGEFYASNLLVYENAAPLPGATTLLKELQDRGALVCYITRRPELIHATSLAWLETHGFPKLPVLCVPHGESKADVMRSVGANTILEDSGSEAKTCAAAGFRVLLIETPYNQDPIEGVSRFQSWTDPVLRTYLAPALAL